MRIKRLSLFRRNIKSDRTKKRGRKLITFKGDDGKLPRRIAVAAAIITALILIITLFKPEPVIMNSAEVATVWDNGALRVGIRTDVPGFAEDGTGLEAELAELLAGRIMEADNDYEGGSPVELVEVTSMTVGAKLSDGSIDVAISLMPEGGSSGCSYSRAYYTDGIWFIVRPGDENMEIKNVTIGYIQSASSTSLYVPTSVIYRSLSSYITAHPEDGLGATSDHHAYASYGEMIAGLLAGDVDCAVLNGAMINKYKDAGFAVSSTMLSSVGYAVAAESSDSAFTTIADMMLEEMEGDGSLAALYKKYGLEPVSLQSE